MSEKHPPFPPVEHKDAERYGIFLDGKDLVYLYPDAQGGSVRCTTYEKLTWPSWCSEELRKYYFCDLGRRCRCAWLDEAERLAKELEIYDDQDGVPTWAAKWRAFESGVDIFSDEADKLREEEDRRAQLVQQCYINASAWAQWARGEARE